MAHDEVANEQASAVARRWWRSIWTRCHGTLGSAIGRLLPFAADLDAMTGIDRLRTMGLSGRTFVGAQSNH